MDNNKSSNCHRTKKDTTPSTEHYNGSDQDSSKSKEVVPGDKREPKNGPGGY